MTLDEFRAKAYEILTANGYKEIDGEIYFPESSIMNMLEYMHDNVNTTVDIDKALEHVLSAIKKVVSV